MVQRSERLEELDDHVARLKALSLEESTKKSYRSYRKRYLDFCELYNLVPVPVSMSQAARYVGYLSESLSASSIPKYLTILRVLHFEQGLPDPHVMHMHEVKSVLTGVAKLKGLQAHRVKPLTPSLLLKMFDVLDLCNLDNLMFLTACLVGFYGLLRKSNLFPPSKGEFSIHKHLSRGALVPKEWGIELQVQWTKTIQCKERVLCIPLLSLPGHKLCPVTLLRACFVKTPQFGPSSPMFYRYTQKGELIPMLYKWFLEKLRDTLSLIGENPGDFGSHSLRRGGASWALHCGLSSDVIKLLGDWQSSAYQAYLELPPDRKLVHMRAFVGTIPPV